MARILLMKGAKMEAQDDDGGTALFYAVQYSRQPLVALLLEQGANVNATTKKGKTPLMVAVEEDAEEIAEMLIQKGADLNVRNKAGLTALGIARKRGLPRHDQPSHESRRKGLIVHEHCRCTRSKTP